MRKPAIDAASGVKAQFDKSCYYRWAEPNSDITISLNAEAMDRLQMEVLRGLDSYPPSGKEVGGVLQGWTEWDENRMEIVVEDFEPVPSGHGRSQFYYLNDQDSVRLEAVLGQSTPMRSAVGYYRSHTRPGLHLGPDDLRLIAQHFPGQENVFLLIKTLPSRACTAGFFFRKDGSIQADFTDSEVPLIPVSHPGSATETPVGTLAAIPVAASQELHRRDINYRIVYAGLLAAAAAAGFVAVVRDRAPQPSSALVSENARAMIRRELPAPLANPAPVSRTQPSAPIPTPAPKASNQQLRQSAPPVGSESKLPANDFPAPPPEPRGPAELRAASAAIPSAPAGGEASIPASAKLMAAPVNLPPAPDPVRASISPAATPLATVQPFLPAKPATPPPVAPPADPVIPKPAEAAAVPKASAYIGPRVIHQVAPAVPHDVRPRITTDVQLDVEVTISAAGKVTAARVASTKGAAAGLLTIETLKAAQLFRFQPAQESGRNVPSVTVLTFRFEAIVNSNKE